MHNNNHTDRRSRKVKMIYNADSSSEAFWRALIEDYREANDESFRFATEHQLMTGSPVSQTTAQEVVEEWRDYEFTEGDVAYFGTCRDKLRAEEVAQCYYENTGIHCEMIPWEYDRVERCMCCNAKVTAMEIPSFMEKKDNMRMALVLKWIPSAMTEDDVERLELPRHVVCTECAYSTRLKIVEARIVQLADELRGSESADSIFLDVPDPHTLLELLLLSRNGVRL